MSNLRTLRRVGHFGFLRSGSPNCWHSETPPTRPKSDLYLTHAQLGHARRERQSPLCDQCGSHSCAKDAQEWGTLGAGWAGGQSYSPLSLEWTDGDARLSINMMANCEALSRPRSMVRNAFGVSRNR